MEINNNLNILLLMIGIIFSLGIFTFIMGVIVLVTRAMGKDMRSIATQTTRLAQKGITENIPGLVGNASALLNELQQLVKTATGIGLFLITLGAGMMAIAYWLFSKYFEIAL